ncbi:thiazole tautomerase (transcriptional regulator TenI) [Salinibacillus kushneri]|uniref:Thiamine-phosphate synthase n=1 Tax=Salinibacillus kushneri TaxID=237682 RepID=A0A1I0DVN4_9BACI|nr:thiazole tautomerase TenI [Salinibacillus kushneri]SET36689.1 thiazole tautomerase (transcriptional regulator TenI) [Salinibacillus kushneri]
MKREIHAISTGRQSIESLTTIVEEIHPFVDAIHIREKSKTASEIYQIVQKLLENEVPLDKIIINDRVDIAYVCKVQGIHLAHHSLPVYAVKNEFPGLRIGYSCHSLVEARKAEKEGADYLFFGHVYATTSKPGLPPKGLKQLKNICRGVNVPVLAIGGVKPSNIPDILQTGANGIVLMSGIFEAEDPKGAANDLVKKVNKGTGGYT